MMTRLTDHQEKYHHDLTFHYRHVAYKPLITNALCACIPTCIPKVRVRVGDQ